jgi:hypothetical protein
MSEKDALDRYYTPAAVAVAVRQLLTAYVPAGARVIEPSGGGGAFIDACVAIGDREVWAVDIDTDAGGLSRADQFYVGDWIEAVKVLEAMPLRFDLAIGNPPFGGPAVKRGRNPGDPPYLGAHHANAAMRIADCVAFLLPWSWFATPLALKQFSAPPAVLAPLDGRAFGAAMREVTTAIWFPRLPSPKTTIVLPPVGWKQPRRGAAAKGRAS